MKSNIKGNKNNVALGDINNNTTNNFINAVNEQQSEFGVINEIFEYVIVEAQNYNSDSTNCGLTSDKLIHINEKIKINFSNDIREVQMYFTHLYTKIFAVENSFKNLSEDSQQEVHFYISSKYFDLKRQNISSIEILKELAKFFIPPYHASEPTYASIAQAIVLFFFDDCTIFEKTATENPQVNLFDSI